MLDDTSQPLTAPVKATAQPAVVPDTDTPPPSWSDITSNSKWATASPEERLVTFSRWHDDAYNHATDQPFWQDPAKQNAFNTKAAEIQNGLTAAAGGMTPDQARVKLGQDAVTEAQDAATMAESSRPSSAIERDALKTLHPDIAPAYYANKSIPPPEPEGYFGQLLTTVPRALHTVTGLGLNILSSAVKSVGSVIGEGTGNENLETPFKRTSEALDDLSTRLTTMGSEKGTTDPIDITLNKLYPGSTVSSIYGGVSQGTANALNQFVAPENIPLLATGGYGARTLAAVFTGLGIKQLPQEIEQFNAVPDLKSKIATATQAIVAIAAPAFGLKGHAAAKTDAMAELHNHLTELPEPMLQAALSDPKIIPDLKASIQDALKAKEASEITHPVVQAAEDSNAPKTAAEIAPVIKETEKPATETTAASAPDIQFRKGKIIAPPDTTREHFVDWYKSLPAAAKTPDLIGAIKDAMKRNAAAAPETVLGPSLAGEIGKLGETHADLLDRASKGPYAGVALEAFGNDQRHTFRTSKGNDADRATAFQLVKAEQDRTGQQLLKPGVLEEVNAGTRPAELKSEDLQPRPVAKTETPVSLAKWWETFKPAEPTVAEPKSVAAPKPFTGTVEEAAHQAPENLKVPKGATRVRVTTPEGKTSVVLTKDLDTLKDAGPFSKVEAGTVSKGKFLPMNDSVTLREQPKAEAPTPAARTNKVLQPTDIISAEEATKIPGPERIIGVAHKAKSGKIFYQEVGPRGATHADVLDRMPFDEEIASENPDGGFITNKNRFISSREEAHKIATSAKQVANKENRFLEGTDFKPISPKAEAPKSRSIPKWMLQDEEESKLSQGQFAREMKGRGRTTEQKELQIKVGTEHATTKALAQGYPDSYDELHKFTGDSTAAAQLHKDIKEQLAKAYPPQKIPTEAKQVMVQHKETGIKYPTAELPTGEVDAKGKPITKMGTPFTNNALQVAAAFDEGKPQVVPQSLVTADKVNPAIAYEYDPKTSTYKVTGIETKYGVVEKPGDLTRLYDHYTKVVNPQKAFDLVHGEKALAAAEGRVGRETGEEDIHAPEELGAAIGAGEEIPQGKPEDPLAQQDAEERQRFDRIMEEADRLGIDPKTITHTDDTRDPTDLGAKGVKTSYAVNTPEESAKLLQNLHQTGMWREDGKLAPNPLGAYLRWMTSQGKEFPNLIAKEILQNSGLQTGDLLFEIVNNPRGTWAGLYTPKESVEGQRLGLKKDKIQINLALSQDIHETMLHELVHGVFEPVLYDPARQTPRITELWHNIQTLGETAKKYVFEQLYGHAPSNQELIDFTAAYKTGKQVGKFQKNQHSALTFIGDAGEIPTRVLTDKDVQEIFASVNSDSRVPAPKPGGKFSNLLDQAIAYVKLLWPTKTVTPGTLLDQAIDQLVDFIRETGKGPETILPRAGPEKFATAEAANKIERPVLVDTDGKTIVTPNSKFGQSHASAAQEAFTDAAAEDRQKIITALQNGEQHKFQDSTGKILDRTEAATIAKQARQVHQNSPNQLYTDVLNDRAGEVNRPLVKMEAATPKENPGGDIIESMGRGGILSHEVEIDPKASIKQLEALQKQIDDGTKVGKFSAPDAERMKTEVQGILDQKQPFAPHVAAPQAHAAVIAPTGRIGALKEDLMGWWNRAKTAVQAAANKTFPRTTLADQGSGEAMARWVASRTAAPYHSNRFIAHVLEGTEIDMNKFGTALTEDNLRSIAQNPERTGVGTTIGKKGSPFQTEEEYKAFLADPAVKQAIARHIEQWDEIVGPMYRQAMLLDPDVELASRGLQTKARVNLYATKEGEKGGIRTASGLTATLQRKSPFGRVAKGTGTYNTNYADMMANTFGQQLEIANKNEFEKQLVASGNAIIGKPGERPVLADGEATRGVPMRTLTLATEKGNIPLNRYLYVRDSLFAEYLRAADTDPNKVPELAQAAAKVLNRSALAGFTDFTVHGSNLFTSLTTRPSVSGELLADTLLSMTGRADILVDFGKMWIKSSQNNQAQLEQLATIGALRDYIPAGQSKLNPLTWSGKALNWMDKTTRLILDDAYQSMVKEGWVTDSETNRREFVNQVGQYNRRAQNRIVRAARDSGLGPFATAGTTFNALGFRFAGMSPGVKASSALAATALRANVLSKWVGAFTLVMGLNYLVVGKMTGRPGVPIGNVDTGRDDKNGRPLSVPVFDLIGAGRALRVTGIHGGLEAYRKGLTNADITDSAVRDIYNAQISPFAGPPIRFLGSFANVSPFMGVPPPSPQVASGENQVKSNIENAAISANPIAASIREYRRGAGLVTALEKQFPRFVPKATQPASMMEHYPEIVRKAVNSKFVDDVIRQARYMEPNERSEFVKDALSRITDSGDRERAKKTLKYRRIQY